MYVLSKCIQLVVCFTKKLLFQKLKFLCVLFLNTIKSVPFLHYLLFSFKSVKNLRQFSLPTELFVCKDKFDIVCY